jgi:hypothetical protein
VTAKQLHSASLDPNTRLPDSWTEYSTIASFHFYCSGGLPLASQYASNPIFTPPSLPRAACANKTVLSSELRHQTYANANTKAAKHPVAKALLIQRFMTTPRWNASIRP